MLRTCKLHSMEAIYYQTNRNQSEQMSNVPDNDQYQGTSNIIPRKYILDPCSRGIVRDKTKSIPDCSRLYYALV